MEINQITYITRQPGFSPLEHLRILGPLKKTSIKILMGLENEKLNYKTIDQGQLIIFQRDFPSDLELYRQVVNYAHQLSKPVIYDLDDHLLGLPENHPDRQSNIYAPALLPMLEALVTADAVTVSTNKLKETFLEYNRNIFVLPNFFDDAFWPFQIPKSREQKDYLTIGYMGGDSHKPDLEWIAPVLLKISNEYCERIHFHFYGVKPPELLDQSDFVHWTPIKTYNYQEFAVDFQKMDVDIFIAPLIDNLFNRCKSHIKFLEYTSLGIPGVYSRLEPYSEVVNNTENGLLATSLDEWYTQIVRLIQEPNLGYKLAENAQRTVKEKWLMSKNAHLWESTYEKICEINLPQVCRKIIPFEMIQILSDQLDRLHNSLDQTNNELTKQLTEHKQAIDVLKEKLTATEDEILSYALSKSWRLTRPLRKIKTLIKEKVND